MIRIRAILRTTEEMSWSVHNVFLRLDFVNSIFQYLPAPSISPRGQTTNAHSFLTLLTFQLDTHRNLEPTLNSSMKNSEEKFETDQLSNTSPRYASSPRGWVDFELKTPWFPNFRYRKTEMTFWFRQWFRHLFGLGSNRSFSLSRNKKINRKPSSGKS